jgi:hypothetical protein
MNEATSRAPASPLQPRLREVRALQSRAEERDQLVALYRWDSTAIKRELDQQFTTLHNRAQLLLGLCGVLLTAAVLITTGRIIGRGTYSLQHVAGLCLGAAGFCDIVATTIIVGGVLHIRWLTPGPGEDLGAWTLRAVSHRDRKTRAYHAALVVLMLSMAFYEAAVLIVVLQL